MSKISRIAIVAGEASGDILGAGLVQALKRKYPDCIFEGIGGPRMIEAGFISHYPMDRLAVMGLVEPLKRLPELLAIRKDLRQRYTQNPPDVFIGIDAPDFNLTLEKAIRENGTKTVHYVSPSVWAWRRGRLKKIAKAVDLMLTLFPFEESFYQEHHIGVRFVGHPLADDIPIEDQKDQAREALSLDKEATYLAILPGSRRSEVEKLSTVFFQAASLCVKQKADIKLIVPAANESRYKEIETYLSQFPELDVTLLHGESHKVMAAADVILIASGTSTLEALLLKRPMVIAYRVASLTYWILKRLVKSKYIGLPNLLANKELVPELIQDDATPERLAEELMARIQSGDGNKKLLREYITIHKTLKKNASEEAANAVEELWAK